MRYKQKKMNAWSVKGTAHLIKPKEQENEAKMTMANESTCLVCLESNTCTGFSLVQLNDDESKCRHSVCRACLRHYLVQSENDRKTNATCPEPNCRIPILQSVVEDSLGRAYSPKVWMPTKKEQEAANGKNRDDDKESLDGDFKQWLRENGAVQCLNCHVFITQSEGCDAMQVGFQLFTWA